MHRKTQRFKECEVGSTTGNCWGYTQIKCPPVDPPCPKWLRHRKRTSGTRVKPNSSARRGSQTTVVPYNFIRLSGCRVKHSLMMTFVYHCGQWDTLSRQSSYRVKHSLMLTFVYHCEEYNTLSWYWNNGETNALTADPKPNKQANLQRRFITNPICKNLKKYWCIMFAWFLSLVYGLWDTQWSLATPREITSQQWI